MTQLDIIHIVLDEHELHSVAANIVHHTDDP
jgi:hypothetical protein